MSSAGFKQGDRIRHIRTGWRGTIEGRKGDRYRVQWDHAKGGSAGFMFKTEVLKAEDEPAPRVSQEIRSTYEALWGQWDAHVTACEICRPEEGPDDPRPDDLRCDKESEVMQQIHTLEDQHPGLSEVS